MRLRIRAFIRCDRSLHRRTNLLLVFAESLKSQHGVVVQLIRGQDSSQMPFDGLDDFSHGIARLWFGLHLDWTVHRWFVHGFSPSLKKDFHHHSRRWRRDPDFSGWRSSASR